MSAPDHRQLDLIRDRFTRTADAFADFVLSQRRNEAAHLAHLCAFSGRERVLDMCCGPGTLALEFAPRVGWVCGLDITPAMLERARRSAGERGLQHVAFLCAEAAVTPFAAGVFDAVACSYSLHHLCDVAALIRDAVRVLVPGGRLALLDHIVPEDEEQAKNNNLIECTRDASHVRTLPVSEIQALCKHAGLEITAHEIDTHARAFDQWMSVAGLVRGDAAYAKTRELMEASMPGDSACFHPKFLSPVPDVSLEPPDIEFVQTTVFLTGRKVCD